MRFGRMWAGIVAVSATATAVTAASVAAQAPKAQAPAPAPVIDTRGSVERGRYLVESVAMCGECHSTRDQDGDIVMGTRLKGGPMPARVPWSTDWPVMAPAIAGLPAYSDAEATRLLTQGAIRRDGTRARAPMPRFRMSAQDAADVIAYLRTR